MAEINPSNSDKRKSNFSTSINRRSTRVDLTPMVDLGFLLITFFVFTTAMTQPKVMTLIEPKDGTSIPVKESGAMTIILGKDHQIWYYYKIFNNQMGAEQFEKTDFKSIRSLIRNKKNITESGDLMYIIKADRNSTFGDSIDLLDEMAICNILKGHYAEVDITKAESDILESIN